jgi:hypothetical protein
MTNHIETKIREILDPDFQSMFSELCDCIQLDRDQFLDQPLSYLLMVSVREAKALTRQHLAIDGVLTKKVDKLRYESIVHCVCRELVNRAGSHIEAFDGKTVLSLIKQCRKACAPTPPRQKKLTRRESNRRFQRDLIEQRRKNGVY